MRAGCTEDPHRLEWLPVSSTTAPTWACAAGQDWAHDFELWLTDAPTQGWEQQLYPNTEVHQGFLEQFQAVSNTSVRSPSPAYQHCS